MDYSNWSSGASVASNLLGIASWLHPVGRLGHYATRMFTGSDQVDRGIDNITGNQDPNIGTGADNLAVGFNDADNAMWQFEKNNEFLDKINSYNSAEAQKNRDWQEYMSNTATQRAVEDIKSAGLNPWLALNGGGLSPASTPSGATASSGSGQVSQPSSAIYRAYLQLIGSLANSAGKVIAAGMS